MSDNQEEIISNTGPKKEPFCRVCFNKGKPKQVYRSHYVKSEKGMNGVIVCPELAWMKEVECNYCHVIGHTKDYCYVLKMKNYGCTYCSTFGHKQKNCMKMRLERDMLRADEEQQEARYYRRRRREEYWETHYEEREMLDRMLHRASPADRAILEMRSRIFVDQQYYRP